MEPLLVIGLGGIGSMIAQSARKRMMRDPAARRQIEEGVVQFIAIDTAKKCWAPDLATTYVDLEPGFRGPVAIDDLRLHEFFRNGWPEGFRPSNVMEGSQVRALGRLAYLRKVLLRDPATFRDRVDAAYQSALTFWAAPAAGSASRRSLTVAICGSATGGTCSGTLLDIAFAVRSYIRSRAGIEPYIFAFLLDPEAVALVRAAASDERRLNANYIALMLELEYWMNSGWGDKLTNSAARYDLHYPENSRMAPFNAPPDGRAESPIDLTFHVCGTFQDGSVLPIGRYEPLVDLAGEALYTMSRTSAVAGLTAFAQGASNLEPGPNGMMQRHGSFGAIALRIPAEKIAAYLSAKRAETAFDSMIAEPHTAAAAARANAFIEQARLRADDDDIRSHFERPEPPMPEILEPALLIDSFSKQEWQVQYAEWRKNFEGWKRAVEARCAAARQAQALEILDIGAQSLKVMLDNAAVEDGTAMAAAVGAAVEARLANEHAQLMKKIGEAEVALSRDGVYGDAACDRQQSAVAKAYASWFGRGRREALDSFAAFLRQQKTYQMALAFYRAAAGLVSDGMVDARRWEETYLWVGTHCVRNARALLATVDQSQTREKLKRELPARLNFSSGATAGDFALEFDVLGARDVVDEMITPMTMLGRADDSQASARQSIVRDSNHGVIVVAEKVHQAFRASDAGDKSKFAELEEDARSKRLATALLKVAREAGMSLCKEFLDSLTLDRALELEAEFILRRQQEWSRYFDKDSAEALVHAKNDGDRRSEINKVIELRLDIFRKKAVIAAQQATARGATGNPAHQVHILSGNGVMNPLVWRTMGNLTNVQFDDRQTEDDVSATAQWKSMVLLTTVAYGFELWWLSSFHKALPSYNWWISHYDSSAYPVHTDKRYRTTWPINLPFLPAQQEAIVALAMAEASNLVKKEDDVFRIEGGTIDESVPLGRTYAEVVDRILYDETANEAILRIRAAVDAEIAAQTDPKLAYHDLFQKAMINIKKHVENTPPWQRRRVRGAHETVRAHAEQYPPPASVRLEVKPSAEPASRPPANGSNDA